MELVFVVIFLAASSALVAYLLWSPGWYARHKLEEAVRTVPGFVATQLVIPNLESAIAVDEHSRKICFAELKRGEVVTHTYTYAQVMGCDLIMHNYAQMSGGYSLVEYILKTTVDDLSNPAHIIHFPGETEAHHWHSLLSVIAEQSKSIHKLSPAQELSELATLRASGALSEDEWARAKELFLGSPTKKREELVSLIGDLHSLYKRGALSESEFNHKKWQLLSRRDL